MDAYNLQKLSSQSSLHYVSLLVHSGLCKVDTVLTYKIKAYKKRLTHWCRPLFFGIGYIRWCLIMIAKSIPPIFKRIIRAISLYSLHIEMALLFLNTLSTSSYITSYDFASSRRICCFNLPKNVAFISIRS